MNNIKTIEILTKYQSPIEEASFAKGIPMKYLKQIQAATLFADGMQGVKGLRYAFRGAAKYKTSANKTGYHKRPQAFCHKDMAETFAIYERSL